MNTKKPLRSYTVEKIHPLYCFAILIIICSFAIWTQLVLLTVNSDEGLQNNISQEVSVPEIKHDLASKKSPLKLLGSANIDSDSIHNAPNADAISKPSSQDVDISSYQKPDSGDTYSKMELEQWGLKNKYSLHIPSIKVQTNVLVPKSTYWDKKEWTVLEKQMQIGLNNGAVAYPHSVAPGNQGTLIIAGHSSPPNEFSEQSNFGDLFARLPELTNGDIISVLSKDGTYVDYSFVSAEVVPATNTSILAQQKDDSLLKLITCFPVGTTKDRWVVTAKKI